MVGEFGRPREGEGAVQVTEPLLGVEMGSDQFQAALPHSPRVVGLRGVSAHQNHLEQDE